MRKILIFKEIPVGFGDFMDLQSVQNVSLGVRCDFRKRLLSEWIGMLCLWLTSLVVTQLQLQVPFFVTLHAES